MHSIRQQQYTNDSYEDDNNDIVKPTLNTSFNDNNILINKIKCGESHSLIIDTNGYGYCRQNTYGDGSTTDYNINNRMRNNTHTTV